MYTCKLYFRITQMLCDLNPNSKFGCHACWVLKMTSFTPKHKKGKMTKHISNERQGVYVEKPYEYRLKK